MVFCQSEAGAAKPCREDGLLESDLEVTRSLAARGLDEHENRVNEDKRDSSAVDRLADLIQSMRDGLV